MRFALLAILLISCDPPAPPTPAPTPPPPPPLPIPEPPKPEPKPQRDPREVMDEILKNRVQVSDSEFSKAPDPKAPPSKTSRLIPEAKIGYADPKSPLAINATPDDKHQRACDLTTIESDWKPKKEVKPFTGKIRLLFADSLANLNPRSSYDVPYIVEFGKDSKEAARVTTVKIRSESAVKMRLRKKFEGLKSDRLLTMERLEKFPYIAPIMHGIFILDSMAGFFRWLEGESVESHFSPGEGAMGMIHVVVPPTLSAGTYRGVLEISGNFQTVSLPFALKVVNHRDQIGRSMENLTKSPDALSLGEIMGQPESSRGCFVPFGDPEGKPTVHDVWNDWILADDSIWDLRNVQTIGPLLQTTEGVKQMRLIGPKLFVLREKSVDVVDVRERRTLQQLAAPAPLEKPMAVSADGSRVIVRDKESRVWVFNGAADPIRVPDLKTSYFVANAAADRILALTSNGLRGVDIGERIESRDIPLSFKPRGFGGANRALGVAVVMDSDHIAVVRLKDFTTSSFRLSFDRIWSIDFDEVVGMVIFQDSDGNVDVYYPDLAKHERRPKDSMKNADRTPIPQCSYKWSRRTGGIFIHR